MSDGRLGRLRVNCRFRCCMCRTIGVVLTLCEKDECEVKKNLFRFSVSLKWEKLGNSCLFFACVQFVSFSFIKASSFRFPVAGKKHHSDLAASRQSPRCSVQNRCQKVVNRGASRLCRGVDIQIWRKFHQVVVSSQFGGLSPPSCSVISIWGAKPTKAPPWRRDWFSNVFFLHSHFQIEELCDEEPEWTDYDADELTVKMQLTDSVFDLLLNDTVQCFEDIEQRRAAAL